MAKGDFTASNLLAVQEAAEDMWKDAATNRDYVNEIDSVKAISDNQTIKANKVLVEGLCREVEVSWIKYDCDEKDLTLDAASADCEIDGDEFETQKKSYYVNEGMQDSFVVWDHQCDNAITIAELIAHGMVTVEQNFEKEMNKKAIVFLNANTDDNTHVVGNIENVVNVGSYFPSADWTPELIGQLAQIMAKNKIDKPIFLTGSNLWLTNFNAQYNQLNSDQKDQIAKMRHFKNWYWDILNLDDQLALNATFGFAGGSVALLNKHFNMTEKPENQKDQLNTHTWKSNAKRLMWKNGNSSMPMVIDWFHQRKCKTASDGRKIWGTAYMAQLRYEFVSSPIGCDGKLGIFKFINGVAP